MYKNLRVVSATYGEKVRHFLIRSGKHIDLSLVTNEKVKPKEISVKDNLLLCNHTKEISVKDNLLLCNHTPSLDDFSLLVHEDQKFCLEINESLLIKQEH